MKQPLHTKFTKLTAVLASIVTIFSAALSAAPAFAWGPSRTTYTNASPAPYATFNSITDNVALGDERNFVRIRDASVDDSVFVDELEIVPGKEYEVYIYYHNDAASNTNETGFGIATNTRVSTIFPDTLNPGDRSAVSGVISWSYVTPSDPNNAQTGKVWDEAYVTTSTPNTTLKFKPASAIIHNSGAANGTVLSTAIFTEEGTAIGYNKLAGTIPGCAEYSGYITYRLIAEAPSEDCTTNPSLEGCTEPETCETNPDLDGCNPAAVEDCETNPSLPGCTEDTPEDTPEETPTTIVNTGPVQIIMAIVVVLAILGGGFYLWRTRRTLKHVEKTVKGENTSQKESEHKDDPQDGPKTNPTA